MSTQARKGSAGVGRNSRSGRVPGTLNLAVGLLFLLVIVPLALRSSQPAPPQIAEFSPQANQIKDTPKELTANLGKASAGGDSAGAGQGFAGGASPSPSALGTILGNTGRQLQTPSVFHCVGTPARQIEDPQSPPCVPSFSGDNPGATSRGVTHDSILVAVPTGAGQDDATLLAFFNSRFEFYGRKLVFVPYSPNPAPGPPEMISDADTVAKKGVFADIGYTNGSLVGASTAFYDELANDRVLSVSAWWAELPYGGEQHMEAKAPYEWNYLPASDKILNNYSEMACKDLIGHPAQYAGIPQNQQAKRVFGVIRETAGDPSRIVDTSGFIKALQHCGASVDGPQDWYGPGSGGAQTQNIVLDFKTQMVTDVICICYTQDLAEGMMGVSSANGYFPEWLISDMYQQDADYSGTLWPPDEAGHIIGLMSTNKNQAQADTPYYWAGKEIDPAYVGTPSDSGVDSQFTYYNMLVLASGIQMAGPNLTPQSFQDALYRTRFPNPGAGGPPYYQATVGFGPQNHTMIQDLAPVWWSSQDQSVTVRRPGAYCYIGLGKRFALGDWPAALTFQDPSKPCR